MAKRIGDQLFPVLEPDNLVGTVDDDYLYGGGENDTLNGSAGVDIFDGGAGTSDVISFAGAAAGVSINLFAVDPGNTVKTVLSFDETNQPTLFGFEGITSATIVDDPAGGTNKVARVVKANDAGASAGTTIGYSYGSQPSDLGLANPIDFTAASTTMTLRVYLETPAAGVKVRLKVEDQSDVGATTEVDALTTGASGWQTLTFDFANEASNNGNATRLLNLADTHNKISVFFNFGVDGESGGGGTYYFDDLKFIETPGPQGTISNDGYGNVETVQNVENVIGSANGDRITGGTGANALDGGAGNDTIDGGTGNDILTGGLGNDLLLGGDGIDKINGGDGIDTVSFAGAENGVNVTIRSGPSTTNLVTFEEAQAPTFVEFGPDNANPANADAVIVSIANDPAGGTNQVGKFEKNAGAFSWAGTVVGTGPNSTVDALPFTASDHTMTMRVWSAVAGTEVLLKLESTTTGGASVGAIATTTVAGAWQTLTFDFGPALTGPGTGALDLNIDYNKVVLFFNFGVDSAMGGGGTFYFDDLKFIGTAVSSIDNDGFGNVEGLTNVENAIGSAFADRLTGDGQKNSLSGGDGNDTLAGGSGNDTLNGGNGTDSMRGGLGNDTYYVGTSTDMVVEEAGQGTDSVISSVTHTLSVNAERLTLSGSTTINGTGNTLANTITGNTGSNILSGGTGNDTLSGGLGNDRLDGGAGTDSLVGGAGNDSYVVDSASDLISEISTLATEIDSVSASASVTLSTNVERLTLTGVSAINGTGNTLANTIAGNTGNNVLSGGSGDDTLSGGAGNDTLDGGAGTDSLVGGLGNDTYVVDSSTDLIRESSTLATEIDSITSSITLTLGDNLEQLTLTGGNTRNGTGNALANTITGNTGGNVLTGGAGNDTLNGGAGNDKLDGGIGNDSLVGGNGNDSYVVDSTTDLISEMSASATEFDSVSSSVTWTLGSNLEQLTLTGTSSRNGAGNALANIIIGSGGNNVINGSGGNDTLTGGAGLDSFRFNSAPSSANADTITDFSVVSDTVQLENGAFANLTTTGTLSALNFRAHSTGNAADTNDFVLYDTDSGQLFYDADGSGTGAKVLIATLQGLPTLTSADIFVT